MKRLALRCAMCLVVLVASGAGEKGAVGAQSPPGAPLPDLDELLDRVHSVLIEQYDQDALLTGYVYQVRTVRDELDRDGFVDKTETSVAEIVHFASGPFRMVQIENGEPLSPKELRKQEEELDKHIRGEDTRGGWPRRRRARDAEDHQKAVDDIFAAYTFTILRREFIRERPVIVVGFEPLPHAPHETYVGKVILPKLRGTVWVDEADSRVARVEAEVFQTITIGQWGVLARIDEGSRYTREWRKVNDEAWLPSSQEGRFDARAFLFDRMSVRYLEEYSNYRKFTTETTFEVLGEDGEQ